MNKELLTVEFRYHDKPKSDLMSEYTGKTITIGVYDTLEEAISEGNKILTKLAEKFEVRADDRFKLHHLFGSPNRLVTNTCYPTNRIQYFAKITKLDYADLDEMITETFDAYERYRLYNLTNDE